MGLDGEKVFSPGSGFQAGAVVEKACVEFDGWKAVLDVAQLGRRHTGQLRQNSLSAPGIASLTK